MNKEESVKLMTDKMAKFVGHIGKKLPDDVIAKLEAVSYTHLLRLTMKWLLTRIR